MNKFKRLMYAKDKEIFAKRKGYISHYDMIQAEYLRLKSQNKVAKLTGMSQQHISTTLIKMGVPRNSRGGSNFNGVRK